jgi:hypothetical protein
MITVTWRVFFTMWEARNQVVHGHDATTQTRARHKKVANELQFLHTKRQAVLATDRDLFIGSTEDELEAHIGHSTPWYIANWIQTWQPVILDSMSKLPRRSLSNLSNPSLITFPQNAPLAIRNALPNPVTLIVTTSGMTATTGSNNTTFASH